MPALENPLHPRLADPVTNQRQASRTSHLDDVREIVVPPSTPPKGKLAKCDLDNNKKATPLTDLRQETIQEKSVAEKSPGCKTLRNGCVQH